MLSVILHRSEELRRGVSSSPLSSKEALSPNNDMTVSCGNGGKAVSHPGIDRILSGS